MAVAKPKTHQGLQTRVMDLLHLLASFALVSVLAILGLILARPTIDDINTYISLQSWIEVPAQLTYLEYIHNTSEFGGETTDYYDLQAAYSYSVNDKNYTSTRVAFAPLSNQTPTSFRKHYKALKQPYLEGRRVTALVNPTEPTESILFEELQTGKLLALGAFILLAISCAMLLLYAGVVGYVRSWYKGK